MKPDLAEAIAALLSDYSYSARELARELSSRGVGTDKSRINSILYSNPQLFRHDGGVPPQWSLATQDVEKDERTPYRVRAIELANWKVFESQAVDFGDITLILGDNSTGKSSIFQALLAMKQTWGMQSFQHEGRLGDFGTYERLVHRHDVDRTVTLVAAWGDRDNQSEWSVGLQLVPDPWDPPYGRVRSIDFQSPTHGVAMLSGVEEGIVSDADVWGAWAIASTEARESSQRQQQAWDENRELLIVGSEEQGFPDVQRAPSELGTVSPDVAESLLSRSRAALRDAGEMLDSIEYIGPFRTVPNRAVEVSWATENEPYLERMLEDEELVDEVNEWLRRFETPYVVEVKRYSDGYGDIQFGLELLHNAGERVQLRDVGFGVSQLLPVIVKLLASREKTILVEEPEAHLHPRLQSVLGDLFILSSQDYGNVILAETHSEPLLLRLQRRIAEGRTSSSEIAVLHVLRLGANSSVVPVPIQENGQLDYQWPGGFFDDRMDDLVAILDPYRGG